MTDISGYHEKMDNLRAARVLGQPEPDVEPPPITAVEHCGWCKGEIAMQVSARGVTALDPAAMPVRRLATGETVWYCNPSCYQASAP